MRKLWQTSKVKMREESVKSMKSRKPKGGCSKCVNMSTRERGVKKSVIRYVRTKWMAPDKCCGILFVHWSGQVH